MFVKTFGLLGNYYFLAVFFSKARRSSYTIAISLLDFQISLKNATVNSVETLALAADCLWSRKVKRLKIILRRQKELNRAGRFHSRDQHLCKFMGTKESVYIRKEINSHRIGLEHQHGRRFIVLERQYGRRDVMWKRSIVWKYGNSWCRTFSYHACAP